MRNAYSGYTYQKQITILLLALMDVERNISEIEIEAKVDSKFDDLKVSINDETFNFQIKDFDSIDISNLEIKNEEILIKGIPHKLSNHNNILFFKHIDVLPNSKILDFKSYKIKNVHIVSMNRENADNFIDNLYKANQNRRYEIEAYFNQILDKRIWNICRINLPTLKTFRTDLQEKSLNISHKLLGFEKILLIEGKPGVGKSHFVNSLLKQYPKNLIYRFWVGNQDKDYQERLKFKNFIQDTNIKLFHDLKDRPVSDIYKEVKNKRLTFIIDGLDHIENYNIEELDKFINFISELKENCKVIILSRPLLKVLEWKKHILENWNKKQTEKVLDKLFHISDYKTQNQIFHLTQGYPLLVTYIAEHYRLNKILPEIEQLKDIDNFYENVIKKEKGKHALSLFLCTNSYIMFSELEFFLNDSKHFIEEFIKEHPYLFDIKLNRISLFHDSFNTYLRKSSINYEEISKKANDLIYNSVINLDKRFLSRLSLFKLTIPQKKEVLRMYSSMNIFEMVIKDNIDIEAVQSFYFGLRDNLYEHCFKDFNVEHYYDLSLIINLLYRDHISTPDGFLYTYVKTLIFNGYSEEDITSSGYVFSMLFYVQTNNPILLYNKVVNDGYLAEHFYRDLEVKINDEEYFFIQHTKAVKKKRIIELLKDRLHFRDYLVLIMENLYIHQKKYVGFEVLVNALDIYLAGFESRAEIELAPFLEKYADSFYYPNWYLKDVKNNLLAKGYEVSKINKNDYNFLTLKELILKHKEIGSYNLCIKLHEYIRLKLYKKEKIDISSISLFWTKYYNRKDYTLLSIPTALKILEQNNFISLEECINLITKIQDISEKGYRYLLGSFIELYPPTEIIPYLENCDWDYLSLEWFLLPTEYINLFSDKLYNYALGQFLKYHGRGNWVDLGEIKNALLSNRLKDIELTFSIVKMKVRVEKSSDFLKKLKNSKIVFDVYEDKDKNKYNRSNEERLKEGIIDFDNTDFVKKTKLSPQEVAKLSDGNYSCLTDTKIFEAFEKEEIRKNFNEILYNAMIGKTRRIDYNYTLYFTPGNILYMIKKYRNKEEFEKAVKSLKKFMELSLLDVKYEEIIV